MSCIGRFLEKMLKKTKRLIFTRTIGITIGSLSTFVLLICALFGRNWLNQRTSWTINTYSASKSDGRTSTNQIDTLQKEVRSYSGLWEICCDEDICQDQCKILDFMKSDFESKTTSSSLYLITSLRRWCILPIISLVMEGIGILFFLTSCCLFSKRLKLPLFGGVLLILSGLCNVLGIIIYISTNDKLGKRKSLDAQYGWSFYFSGGAFFFSEMLGVMMIEDVVKKVTKETKEMESDTESNSDIKTDCRQNLDPPPYPPIGSQEFSQHHSPLPQSDSGFNEMTLKRDKPDKLASSQQVYDCDKLNRAKLTSRVTKVIKVPTELMDDTAPKTSPLEGISDSFYVNVNDLSYPFDKTPSKVSMKKSMSSKCHPPPEAADHECQCHLTPFSFQTCPMAAFNKITDAQGGIQDTVVSTSLKVKDNTASKKNYSGIPQRLLKNVRNMVQFSQTDFNASPSTRARNMSLKQGSSTEPSASNHLPKDIWKRHSTIDRSRKLMKRNNRRLDIYPRSGSLFKQSGLTTRNNYEETNNNLNKACKNRVEATATPEESQRSQSTNMLLQTLYHSVGGRDFAIADSTNLSRSVAHPSATSRLGMKYSHSCCSRTGKETWLPQTQAPHRSESTTNLQRTKEASQLMSNSLPSARRIRKYPRNAMTDDFLTPDTCMEGRGTAI